MALLVLIKPLAQTHARDSGYACARDKPDLVEFHKNEFGPVGADTHYIQRQVIRDLLERQNIMGQDPGTTLVSLLQGQVTANGPPSAIPQTAAPGGREVRATFAEFTISRAAIERGSQHLKERPPLRALRYYEHLC